MYDRDFYFRKQHKKYNVFVYKFASVYILWHIDDKIVLRTGASLVALIFFPYVSDTFTSLQMIVRNIIFVIS